MYTEIPIADRVLVKPNAAEDRTSGGVMIPDITQERILTGTVVAVGPGRATDNGVVLTPQIQVGNTVGFTRSSVFELELNGEIHYIGRELDFLYKK